MHAHVSKSGAANSPGTARPFDLTRTPQAGDARLRGLRPFATDARPARRWGPEATAVQRSWQQRAASAERLPPTRSSAVHDVLRNPGRPLEAPLRAEMEQRLDADLSDVRVHTDTDAQVSARDMCAHAYTCGSHIVFQRGRYDGTSAAGRTLLAHELTHVIQQRQGPVSGRSVGGGLAVSDPQDIFERAAQTNAERVLARPRHATPAPAPGPARAPSALVQPGSTTPSGAHGVVQRTRLDVGSDVVSGTGEEDADKLRRYLRHASWRIIAEVLFRTGSGLSQWDLAIAVSVAREVAEERIARLSWQYSSIGEIGKLFTSAQEYPDFQYFVKVLNRITPKDKQSSDQSLPAPGKRPSSPSLDEPAKHARTAGEVSAAIVSPTTADTMVPDPNPQASISHFLENVLLQAPYADLHRWMLLSKKVWQLVVARFWDGPGAETTFGRLAYGVIRCVARYSPDRTLASEPRSEPRPVMPPGPELVREIARAVGWRNYTSTLRRTGDGVVVTIRSFITEVIEHTTLTMMLRRHTSYPAPPVSYIKNPVLDGRFTALAKQLAGHWLMLATAVPPATKSPGEKSKVPEDEADVQARRVAFLTGENALGGNISVILDKAEALVYSNRPLGTDQQAKLQVHNYALAPGGTARERRSWTAPHGKGRAGGKSQQGQPFDLPFHSEMQRTQTIPPWRLDYAGNMYFACVQCMAAYHALGVPHGPQGGYRGTHAAKVPSVIPPAIRTTSVYLQHYVGTELWQHLHGVITAYMAATDPQTPVDKEHIDRLWPQLTEVFEMLDNVERMNTNFYSQLAIPKGPTTTF